MRLNHCVPLISVFFILLSGISHAQMTAKGAPLTAKQPLFKTRVGQMKFGERRYFSFTSLSDGLERAVVYYLPKSIERLVKSKNAGESTFHGAKTLIFLHGGGHSTTTDESALEAASETYLDQSYINYAETRQVVLIFPASKIGWGGHTSFFLRHLISYLVQNFPVDPDRVVLSGHSMGGMGITREYPWITDLFSGVLAMAAGTPATMLSEDAILPYFNGTPYIHINATDERKRSDKNGHTKDDYSFFTPLMKALEARVIEVGKKFNLSGSFQFRINRGDHDAMLGIPAERAMDTLFLSSRVRYPKFIAVRPIRYHTPAQGKIPPLEGVLDEQYWLKVSGYPESQQEVSSIFVRAEVSHQNIVVNYHQDTLHPQSIVLTLVPELIDLTQPIAVSVNGVPYFYGMIPVDESLSSTVPTARFTIDLSKTKRPADDVENAQ